MSQLTDFVTHLNSDLRTFAEYIENFDGNVIGKFYLNNIIYFKFYIFYDKFNPFNPFERNGNKTISKIIIKFKKILKL